VLESGSKGGGFRGVNKKGMRWNEGDVGVCGAHGDVSQSRGLTGRGWGQLVQAEGGRHLVLFLFGSVEGEKETRGKPAGLIGSFSLFPRERIKVGGTSKPDMYLVRLTWRSLQWGGNTMTGGKKNLGRGKGLPKTFWLTGGGKA